MIPRPNRKAVLCISFLIFFLLLPPSALKAETPIPKPSGLVNDFAGVLSPPYEARIGRVTGELLKKTGTAVVVVTMTDLGGAEYNDYANRLYSAWGIGKKGEDKGVLVFVAVKERKMRIETGYGVEGIIPDGLAGEIRDRYMIPHLRKNNFDEGLLNGTLAIAQVIAKDAGVTLTGETRPAAPRKESRVPLFFPLLVFIFLFFFVLSRRRRGSGLFWGPLILGGGGRSFGRSRSGFGGFSGGFGGFGGGASGGGGAGGRF